MVNSRSQTRFDGKEHTDHNGENFILEDALENGYEIAKK